MRPAIRVLLAVAAVVLAGANEASAAGNERIPLDNWSYPAIERFETLGYCTLPETRPLTRREFTNIVETIRSQAQGAALSARDLYELDRLEREYVGAPPERRYDRAWRAEDAGLAVEMDADVTAFVRRTPFGDEAEAFVASSPEFRAHMGGRATYEVRYKLLFGPEHGDRARNQKPSRREKSFKGLTSLFDRSYVVFDLDPVHLLVGRDHVDWGPSEDGGLIVPGERHGIDQIGARVRFKAFRYDAFFGQLFTSPERYLVGHRLEGTFGRTVIGSSETVIYGGRGPDMLYALPASSFYANQFNERTNSDNILWALDAKTSFDRVTLFAGLLIDDFQFERDGRYPDKLAWEAGFRFVPARPLGLALRGHYRRADTYTYAHDDSLSTYVSGAGEAAGGDVLLGAPAGGDAETWRVDGDVFPRANVRFNLAVFGRRLGEANPIRAFRLGSDDPEPAFPSGVVEETVGFELGARWELDGNRWMAVAYSRESVDNRGRVAGLEASDDAFRLEIRWDIP